MTRDEIRERLRSAPQQPLRGRSDYDLHPTTSPGPAAPPQLKPAGVLVPLINNPSGLTVLLTQRTAHLQKHAGQISFPGGGREPDDPDLVFTALRETEEEIGLPPERVEVLGRLADYRTSTNYGVTPVVGWIEPPFPLRIDPFEVAEAFEVPLSFILDPANHERHSREYGDTRRHFYVLPYETRYIWGATAGMLVNLAEVLRG